MSYLIAIASSDEKNIDLTFGAADSFIIYEVEGTEYHKKEVRQVPQEAGAAEAANGGGAAVGSSCGGSGTGCGNGSGSGCGSGRQGGGCGGPDSHSAKVELIADCRSLVGKKIGFQATKQLEKKAIASFDVDCTVDEALTKISTYFSKIDNHISLRQ